MKLEEKILKISGRGMSKEKSPLDQLDEEVKKRIETKLNVLHETLSERWNFIFEVIKDLFEIISLLKGINEIQIEDNRNLKMISIIEDMGLKVFITNTSSGNDKVYLKENQVIDLNKEILMELKTRVLQGKKEEFLSLSLEEQLKLITLFSKWKVSIEK